MQNFLHGSSFAFSNCFLLNLERLKYFTGDQFNVLVSLNIRFAACTCFLSAFCVGDYYGLILCCKNDRKLTLFISFSCSHIVVTVT